MPTQYETNFTVESRGGLGGVELLQSLIETIEQELRSGEGAADYELETNRVGSVGYAHFSGERTHPSLPATVRLETRLCTLDDAPDVAVQILTRFVSADGVDLPDQPAGPPRLLDAITARFHCRAGTTEISGQPVELSAEDAEAFASAQVFSSERMLPIFLITQNSIDPTAAQRRLQGLAQVAHCLGNADRALMEHTGISTYDGAARIYWPGCQPRQNRRPPQGFRDFFMPNDARRLSLYEVQKACLADAPETDFDIRFSSARTTVILERNRQLEAENRERDAGSVPEDSSRIAGLEKARRTAEVRSNELSRQLQVAQRNVEQLLREKTEAGEIIAGLEEELDELAGHPGGATGEERDQRSRLRRQYDELRSKTAEQEKTIARLNEDNQLLRQRERTRPDAAHRSLSLRAGHIGNITTLNHALNIFRDPCRAFIVRKLRDNHGDDLTAALGRSIEFRDNQRSNAVERPETVFDVGDFSAIIASNWDCFDDWQSLCRRMDDVKRIRNRAAHPPPEGFDEDWTQDSLRTIADTLESLGGKRSAEGVAEIRDLIAATRRI